MPEPEPDPEPEPGPNRATEQVVVPLEASADVVDGSKITAATVPLDVVDGAGSLVVLSVGDLVVVEVCGVLEFEK